ncbi:MAG TPA: TIGR02281 family clan AA aspartic protease [Xanthobacteraceae bacterium]
MQRALLWFLLLGLCLALVLLVARHDDGAIGGLTTHDFASLIVKIGWLVLVGGAVLALFRHRFTQALEAVVLWLVIALLLVLGYTYRFELREVADRVLAELIPGRVAARGRTMELARAQSGEFQIVTEVNGRRVAMILDTGASAVVLTSEAAKAAGLPIELAKYTVNVETANGRARAAAVTLDRVAVGDIVERSVPALVAQPGQLKTSLLGMSFLNRLQSWEVRGDKLVMRAYP